MSSAARPRFGTMQVVLVHVHVLPERVEDFVVATRANSEASIHEPGIARFDVLQSEDDPTRFVLIEAYRTPDAPAAHKETAHYATWRDAVAPMMAEARWAERYDGVHVPD